MAWVNGSWVNQGESLNGNQFGSKNFYGYNGQSYLYGFGTNSLGNSLYYHAGDIANSIRNDSLSLWAREDSAYQRMVEDMKKAGLNPWTGVNSGGLATGSNNPSMDSLTGLLSVLGGLLDTENTFSRSSGNIVNTITKLFNNVAGAIGTFL